MTKSHEKSEPNQSLETKLYPTSTAKCSLGQLIFWHPVCYLNSAIQLKFTNILNLLVNLFVKTASIFTNDIKLNSETVTTTLFNHFYHVLFTNHDETTIGETQNLLLNLILIVDINNPDVSHKKYIVGYIPQSA